MCALKYTNMLDETTNVCFNSTIKLRNAFSSVMIIVNLLILFLFFEFSHIIIDNNNKSSSSSNMMTWLYSSTIWLSVGKNDKNSLCMRQLSIATNNKTSNHQMKMLNNVDRSLWCHKCAFKQVTVTNFVNYNCWVKLKQTGQWICALPYNGSVWFVTSELWNSVVNCFT